MGLLSTLIKAGLVFGLLAVTVKMLRRYDRRVGGNGAELREDHRGPDDATAREIAV